VRLREILLLSTKKSKIHIMKIAFMLVLLLVTTVSFSQTKPKAKAKEKAPTQKEMEAALRDAQGMMDEMMKEMSDEDRKMMDSMGIKLPNMKNVKVPKATDKQWAEAFEDENRIVPKKDNARIAAIPKNVTTAKLPSYIAAIQKKMTGQMEAGTIAIGNNIYKEIQAKTKSTRQSGSMATSLWMSGQPELSLYLLGKVCAEDASDADNLSSYAAALTMQGGEHLAIPILQLLSVKYRKNTTVLNNLGQAWFGLGDIAKAEKYLDSALTIYPYHPQANLTKASIEESRGNVPKAIEAVKKSIRHSYTKEKEEKLNKLGQKLVRKDLRIPFRASADPLGLLNMRRPDYPMSVAQMDPLKPAWDAFNKECDDKMLKIRDEITKLTSQYAASTAAMAKSAMSSIEQGGLFTISQSPFFRKATINLAECKSFYEEKFKKETDRFMTYRKDLDAIEKRFPPPQPEAPCSQRRSVIDGLVKASNERKKQYDEETLPLYRHFYNDMAYWSQFTSTSPLEFKLIVLNFQLDWLQKVRELQPVYDLWSHKGQFKDCVEEEEGKPGKLSDFDDVACNYKATIDYGISRTEISCGRTNTTYFFGTHSYTTKEMGEKYIGATVKVKPRLSVGADAGPLSVEAFVGGDFTIELDEKNQVKDWGGTVGGGIETSAGGNVGPVKVQGTVTTEIEVEVGPNGIGDVNMIGTAEMTAGALGQKVTIGVQDKVSLISGHGSVTGTGIMKGTVLSEW
jgi:tetratricopeptide (TPR) repeat protein